MKVKFLHYILSSFVAIILLNNAVIAQQSDSLIYKAMHDEMRRGMEMQEKDYPAPVFISYTLMYQNAIKILSQQGALLSSDTKKSADATWRLMIGNYQLNDENFDNRLANSSQDVFYEIAKAPIYPDYDGIRNVFWVLTNHSYKAAAPSHKYKKEVIEKYNLAESKDLLADFSTEDRVSISKKRPNYLINKSELEQKTRIYSSAFKNNQGIKFAESKINIIQNDIHFLNSERSQFSIPLDITQLFITIKSDFIDDNSKLRSLSIYTKTPDDLPSDEEVLLEIEKLAQNLNESEAAESLEEDYSGPVLIVGSLVGDVLISNLFSYNFNLNARRQDLIVEDFNKVYFEEIANKLQFKIGEQILPEHISITSYARLAEYNGIKLLGNIDIDSEGVIPQDSLVMVENGMLRNLFSSRIPTNVSSKSTGTKQFIFNKNQIGIRSAPGSLHFRSNEGISMSELKDILIALAKENDFSYAYILRSIPSKIANMPGNCYRVDVKTGEEVLINNANLRYKLRAQTLKNLVATSNSEIVYNTILSNKRYYLNSKRESETGLPFSLIIPSAILVDYAEIKSQVNNKNLNTVHDEISNPLERSQNNH